MNTKAKIQAFTLSEMVVVTILTSFVVGIAFTTLSLVQKHMQGIRDNFNSNTTLNQLEQSLWLDFHRYPNIIFNNGNELVFKSELDSIKYEINKTEIIKNLDTFPAQITKYKKFLKGNEVNKGAVDALRLVTANEDQNQTLFIFKRNDASLFMN